MATVEPGAFLLGEYLLFAAKALTLVLAALVMMVAAVAVAGRNRRVVEKGRLEIIDWSAEVRAMGDALDSAMATPKQRRLLRRAARKHHRTPDMAAEASPRRVFVMDFDGDLQASGVDALRQEITAVLTRAGTGDEVVVRLESAGGLVHGYGLAASQLGRVTAAGVTLTVCVDRVAASGGYLMACVADRILAAPFAILGSIGVMAQIPNIHRLLKRHDIDIELLTAGQYKRTLTVLGENTEEGRRKFQQDLETVHELFKRHVATRRTTLDIDRVATGEIWLGTQALEHNLIDGVQTSDEYLAASAGAGAAIYQVTYRRILSWRERLGVFNLRTAVARTWTGSSGLPRPPM